MKQPTEQELRQSLEDKLGPNATEESISGLMDLNGTIPREAFDSEVIRLRNGHQWGPWRR